MKFNRIWIKVFLIFAVLNISLTLAVYLFNVWSFDRSFERYLEVDRQQHLARFVDRLAQSYEAKGGWPNVVHDQMAIEMMAFETLFQDVSELHSSQRPDPPLPPPNRLRGGLPMGLVLLDENRQMLLGEDIFPDAKLVPILVDARIVGYLKPPPSPPLPPSVSLAFVEQQRHSFWQIAIGMLLASLLGAFCIARWLGRAIGNLAQGAHALIQGDCSIRLEPGSRDELGQLALDFNALAQTLAANRESRREWLVNIAHELRMPLSVMLGEIETMREWIVNIAHELRTPLTVIQGEIEAVEDGIRQYDRNWLQRVGAKTRQLSLMVNDLHRLALSDQGALAYRKLCVDMGGLVQNYVNNYCLSFDHLGLHVHMDIEPDIFVLGDEDRLRQLLCNFLQNTLRYTDMPGTLQITVWREHDRVFLTWEDSAPGVPDIALDKLTDRLYRGEESRSRAANGSGLGLSIARAIMDAHNGSMLASHSRLGGLRWTLQWPLMQELECV